MTKQLTLAMLIIALTLTSTLTTLSAQVTIGSTQPPAAGALLDLKTEADGTSKKGMVLPRVKLSDVDALTMGTNVIANANNAWKNHAGLAVYNVSGEAIPKCAPIPDGLYVWDGAKWNGINPPKPVDPATLDVGTQSVFDLLSGRDARGAIAAQSFTATWQSADGTVSYTNTPHTTLGGVVFSGANILPASGALTPSPRMFSLLPNAMTIANINAPWQSKETTLAFSATNECGAATTKTVTLNQTNYGLTVNGKVIPDQVDVTASGAQTANIASNA